MVRIIILIAMLALTGCAARHECQITASYGEISVAAQWRIER